MKGLCKQAIVHLPKGKKAFVCLLLVCSFLYNPFLASEHYSAALTVRHPASYRATVASDEFLKFKTGGNHDSLVAPILLLLAFFFPLQAPQGAGNFRPHLEVALLPDSLLSADLWFRPPPAA